MSDRLYTTEEVAYLDPCPECLGAPIRCDTCRGVGVTLDTGGPVVVCQGRFDGCEHNWSVRAMVGMEAPHSAECVDCGRLVLSRAAVAKRGAMAPRPIFHTTPAAPADPRDTAVANDPLPALAIGSPTWPGLSKLIEEAGEMLQQAGKVAAYPGGEHPSGDDIVTGVLHEMADVYAAIEFVLLANADRLDEGAFRARVDTKLRRFLGWHRQLTTKED